MRQQMYVFQFVFYTSEEKTREEKKTQQTNKDIIASTA